MDVPSKKYPFAPPVTQDRRTLQLCYSTMPYIYDYSLNLKIARIGGMSCNEYDS